MRVASKILAPALGSALLIGCGIGTSSASGSGQDQAMCVTELLQHASEPGCSGTVGQWTTCIDWLDANWCTSTPATRPAECNVIQPTCYGSGTLADGGVERASRSS
jgi:hypothetical protein